MEYLVIKWVHILSSTVLFGTGIGSALYLLTAVLSRDPRTIAHVSRWLCGPTGYSPPQRLCCSP